MLNDIRLDWINLRPAKVLNGLSVVRLNHAHLFNNEKRVLQQLFQSWKWLHHLALRVAKSRLWHWRHRSLGLNLDIWDPSAWSVRLTLTVCEVVGNFWSLVDFIHRSELALHG